MAVQRILSLPRIALRSLAFSVRRDGLRATLRRLGERLYGEEEWCVFVRPLEAPAEAVALPVEDNGVTVRRMEEEDLEEVARIMPFELDRRAPRDRLPRLRERLPGGYVASRSDEIVGAAWYLDRVGPAQPWFAVVEPHLRWPAMLTANIFVLAGERGAAWALARHATEEVAARGVRSLVSLVHAENRAPMLVCRLLGGVLVGRCRIRYRLGRRRVSVEPTR